MATKTYQNMLWLNAHHGRVTTGVYRGLVLRAGLSAAKAPYVDILLTHDGWNRLIDGYSLQDDNTDASEVTHEALLRWLDTWLTAAEDD